MQYKVLSIAGSDSGGGAGIQADLKTFSALGCYGMTVITAITAQNTMGVQGIYNVPLEGISQQLSSVMDDIGADAIKIGMLHRPDIIEVVGDYLRNLNGTIPIVVDPVMVAKSGHHLLVEEAIESLKNKIFPLATVIIPNVPEASVLLGKEITSRADMEQVARNLCDLGPMAVIVKGGHLDSFTSDDCLWEKDKHEAFWVSSPRVETLNTHGTGCTFAAAITAHLAKGQSIRETVELSKSYIYQALCAGSPYKIGHGHGPVHHFFQQQKHS